MCSSLLRPWARILKEAAGCHSFQGGPEADPKFRKSEGDKENQSALRLGDGQSPTSGLQTGFPGVTSSGDSGNLRWSTLLAKAVQVKSHRHRSQTHLHGRPGLEWQLCDEICTDHLPVTGDCTQRSVVSYGGCTRARFTHLSFWDFPKGKQPSKHRGSQ